jgi:hypothetical protein
MGFGINHDRHFYSREVARTHNTVFMPAADDVLLRSLVLLISFRSRGTKTRFENRSRHKHKTLVAMGLTANQTKP